MLIVATIRTCLNGVRDLCLAAPFSKVCCSECEPLRVGLAALRAVSCLFGLGDLLVRCQCLLAGCCCSVIW